MKIRLLAAGVIVLMALTACQPKSNKCTGYGCGMPRDADPHPTPTHTLDPGIVIKNQPAPPSGGN